MNINAMLCNFNNYTDRKVKIGTINDFLASGVFVQYLQDSKGNISLLNFNPNDGVDTELVVQMAESVKANYLVAIDPYNLDDDNMPKILSKWYIIDATRNRVGQYRLTLHRDVLADNWANITASTVYCNRGVLSDNNPLVFNPESYSVNQIKTTRVALQDITNRAWIVGYVQAGDITSTQGQFNTSSKMRYANTYAAWGSYPYNNYRNSVGNIIADTWDYTISITINSDIAKFNKNGCVQASYIYTQEQLNQIAAKITTANWNSFNNGLTSIMQTTAASIRTEQNKAYYITAVSQGYIMNVKETIVDVGQTFSTTYGDIVRNAIYEVTGVYPSTAIIKYSGEAQKIILTNLSTSDFGELNCEIKSQAKPLQDAPYRMFCVPYADTYIGSIKMLKDDAINIATAIATSSSIVYDLQLVPYCPIPNYWDNANSKVSLTGLTLDVDYTEVKDTNSVIKGYLLWADKSTFSFNINKTATSVRNPNFDKYNYKLWHTTRKYRLVSPNWNGMYEFSGAMNHGVDSYIVDCTYKPYNPYIHVCPIFKGLNGTWNDARGLICNGDFSMPIITDQWKEYEVNNKNYQEQFNREVESIELQNKWNFASDSINAITGTVGSAALGGKLFGLGGGIAGGITSAVAGIADVVGNEQIRQDQLDLKKDTFNMKLENIQALPNVLTKVSAYNANNEIFPFLEEYRCTDTELEAIIKYLDYNGMNVNTVGIISDFKQNTGDFFSGSIVDYSGTEDAHMINEINKELQMGVRIYA